VRDVTTNLDFIKD